MKLINGQIRLIEKFDTENRDRAYVCEQLENPGLECFVKILDRNKHNALIEDYIEKIDFYKSIDHKGVLSTIDFGPVRTVDLKESSSGLYYVLSEYTPWDTLDLAMGSLNMNSRVILVLKLIEALEYLHFRGISYDVLSPDKIFVNSEGDMRLLSVTSIVHSKLQVDNLKRIREYIAPESRENNNGNNLQSDCWSLGVIVGKLFSETRLELPVGKQDFIDGLIDDLMVRSTSPSRNPLKGYFEALRNEFGIDYTRNLREEREKILTALEDWLDLKINRRRLARLRR